VERSPEVEGFVRSLHDMLRSGDAAGLAKHFSTADGVTLIGTDPDELWVGHDTISEIWQAQLGEVGSIEVEDADPVGYARGDVGWMSDRPTLVVGGEMRVPLRVTAVVERDGGSWKVVQWHASIGVSNEESFGAELTTEAGQRA
jgi:hypothetical protein